MAELRNAIAGPLTCPQCRTTLLAPEFFGSPAPVPCPTCRTPVRLLAFPALFRAIPRGATPEAVMIEGESSCFYHPQKKAVTPCAHCGRFLCALCDLEFASQHLCPACLETAQTQATVQALENRRVRYDNVALGVALLPILLGPFTLVTAPAAIYLTIRYWNAPRSITGSGRGRFILAIVLALPQIAAWGIGLYALFTR